MVAHRVVRRVFARKRTDAPARVHVELHETPRERGAPLGARDSAPERVTGVARHGRDLPLVAVESLRVALLGFHPEVALETLSQLLGFAPQTTGARAITVDVVQIRDPHLRRVHVRLHLDERRGKLRPLAVRIRKGLCGVLPALAAHLARAVAVLDVPVLVGIAVRIAPGERALGMR